MFASYVGMKWTMWSSNNIVIHYAVSSSKWQCDCCVCCSIVSMMLAYFDLVILFQNLCMQSPAADPCWVQRCVRLCNAALLLKSSSLQCGLFLRHVAMARASAKCCFALTYLITFCLRHWVVTGWYDAMFHWLSDWLIVLFDWIRFSSVSFACCVTNNSPFHFTPSLVARSFLPCWIYMVSKDMVRISLCSTVVLGYIATLHIFGNLTFAMSINTLILMTSQPECDDKPLVLSFDPVMTPA